jgi:hypothetical protein
MNFNSIKINETEIFDNGWGFYVDIENPHIPISKYNFVNGKYHRNYYNCYDKIDEELDYYEHEYDKKREEKSKQIDALKELEDIDIIKKDSSSLLFNISSVTLITATLSYCFLFAL